MSDAERSEDPDGGHSQDVGSDGNEAEAIEREEMDLDFDPDIARLGERSATVARRFRWAFIGSFWIAAAVLTLALDFWRMLLALLPPAILTTRPCLVVSETFRCVTEKSVEAVDADFSGPLTPLTANWLGTADAVFAPAPEDGDDALAVLRYSGRRTSVDRVLREERLPDGRRGVALESGNDPMVVSTVQSRGDQTDVAVEAQRGPLSVLDLLVTALTARYGEAILRQYGYEVTDQDREYDLALDAFVPW